MVAIGIFAEPGDYHANAVRWGLRRRGHRCDLVFLSDLPQQARVSVSSQPSGGDVAYFKDDAGTEVDLYGLHSCWFRRPNPSILPANLHPGDVDPVREAWSCLHRGLLRSISEATFCVNSALSNEAGRHKLHQIRVAREVGLEVPDTIVTNDGEVSRQFIRKNAEIGSRTIVKGLFSPAWELVGGGLAVLETAYVDEDDIIDAELRIAPCVFQREVRKMYEVRATVMGKTVFAARLNSQEIDGASLDYRRARQWSDLGCEHIDVPESVLEKIFSFQRRMGLNFGTMDFIVTEDGAWVFLETNPQGQFLWVENANADIPLLDAFVDFLVSATDDFKYIPRNDGLISMEIYRAETDGFRDEDLASEERKHVRRVISTYPEPPI